MLQKHLSEVLSTTKKHIQKLNDLGVYTLEDFFMFFPRAYEDHSNIYNVSDVVVNEKISVVGIVDNLRGIRTRNNKFLVTGKLSDGSFSLKVVWFNQPYILRVLKSGDKVIFTGQIKHMFGAYQMVSPTFEILKKDMIHTSRIVPIYHETEKISSKWIREKLYPLTNWIKDFEEHLPDFLCKEYDLISYSKAVKEVHFPTSSKLLDKARKRLSFDEMFFIQLRVLLKRWKYREEGTGHKKQIEIDEKVYKNFLKSLDFELTGAQKRVIEEIFQDFGKKYPMMRLLQGDVGSGKTVVAVAGALMALKAGYQVAIMAPTEILAKQHYKSFYNTFKNYNFNVQFLSGSMTVKEKEKVVNSLKSGTCDLIIGTHAIIQEKVGFKNLGFVVIDEQHRFGVKQRQKLISFGKPHVLYMTATPIPRTMAMTLYGDSELSIIDEMPPYRKSVITRVVPENKRIDAYRWIDNNIEKGRQVFVICPLIEESEALQIKSAVEEYAKLSEHIFSNRKVALLHGRLKQEEKDEIMNKFKDGKIDILVSTSVIEVGIDVPNANIILIEGSERFGLSQLHQFRGRVGRGEHQSYCFLFTDSKSEDSLKRLNYLVKFDDGFKLSEIDLELRGPGEIYGFKQSGIPDLKMASYADSKLMNLTRKAAIQIIKKDPTLNDFPKLRAKLDNNSE